MHSCVCVCVCVGGGGGGGGGLGLQGHANTKILHTHFSSVLL